MLIGLFCGVWDLFHVGHLRALQEAKERCDVLIVGVNTDRLSQVYKQKIPVIPQYQRKEIIDGLSCVDDSIYVDTLDRNKLFKSLKVGVVFAGDSWENTPRYKKYQEDNPNIDFEFIPETPSISTTSLIKKIHHDIQHAIADKSILGHLQEQGVGTCFVHDWCSRHDYADNVGLLQDSWKGEHVHLAKE